MSRRVAATVGLVVCLALALSGCVSLPTSGPVRTSSNTGSGDQPAPIDIDPPGPPRGGSPADIVSGFLNAMQQTPIGTRVARRFLTSQAAVAWQPTSTITYEEHSVPHGSSSVLVSLTGADRLDARGGWQGQVPPNEGEHYDLSFSVVQQGGQWRIDNPPDALIVPESWFEERFSQVSLYFFDPTGKVLVPDPVFVPTGRQLASSLIEGLLAGPPPELAGYSLDLLPDNLHVALSVPVSAKTGIADVQLTGGTGADSVPPGGDAALLVAQLALTLQQDPQIQGLRLSIGGQPVRVDGRTQFSIEAGDRYAPSISGSSTLVYGLVDGRMVTGSAQNLDPVTGPFGTGDLGVRDIVPDLRADQAAGVTTDGTSLMVGPVTARGTGPTVVLSGGQDLLTPAWDFAGRVWTIDRRSTGAVVHVIDQGGQARTLQVRGVTGSDVKRFLVSRDGSRLVAVVRNGRDDDSIVVSRILDSPQGRVVRALPAQTVAEEDAAPGLAIRDIAWLSPTSIVVLHPVGTSLYQVRTATVDGAPSGPDNLTLTLTGDFTALAGTPSPGPGQSTYAVGRGRLVDLSGPRAGSVDIDPDVEALTYPG